MSNNKKFTSYGLREINVLGMISDGPTGSVYANELVRCFGAQSASATITVTENELRGDDSVIEIDSTISSAEFSFENAVVSFEQLKAILGGAITDVMGDEEAVIGQRYTIQAGQSLPYFALIGKTEKEGTMKFVLPKCKATGGIEFSFADEEYCVLSISGKAVRRESDEKLMDLVKYDEINPISIEDITK